MLIIIIIIIIIILVRALRIKYSERVQFANKANLVILRFWIIINKCTRLFNPVEAIFQTQPSL